MLLGKREGFSYALMGCYWHKEGLVRCLEGRNPLWLLEVHTWLFSGQFVLCGEWGQELGKLSDRIMAI